MKESLFKNRRQSFLEGMRDGIPIGLGYLAVAFSLGIAAQKVGVSPLQSFVYSFLCNASAGEYAGFQVIGNDAPYLEAAVMTFVANARYLLMSCAMSQRMHPNIGFGHRMLMSFDITDEVFGITIARPGYLNPFYMYGAMVVAIPSWATGTALGAVAGNILPVNVVSALSVALYGMFLAIIMPAAKQDRVISILVLICFGLSFCCSVLPVISQLSEGIRTIILTVAISSAAAIFFPVKEEEGVLEHDA